MPVHSAPIQISSRDRDLFKTSSVLLQKASNIGAYDQAKIEVVKGLTIPAEMESLVISVTSCHGLMIIEHIPTYGQADK